MASHASTAEHRRSVMIPQIETDDGVPADIDDAPHRSILDEDGDQPVRHLYIDWPGASIKGTYTIGASVPDVSPPLYDLPLREVVQDNAASAVFHSRTSPIQVTVNVMHGHGGHSPYTPQTPYTRDTPQVSPALLSDSMRKNNVFVSAKSVRNSVTVHVPQYVGRRPLHIRCQSTTGNVTVVLPHSFNGMLSWRVETGTFHMSPGVTSHAKRLDAGTNKRQGTAKMVVDPDLPAWMTGNGKRGDVCELSTNTGRLTVVMSGEKKGAGCVVC